MRSWPFGGDWVGLDGSQMVEVVVSLCNAVTKTYDAIGFHLPSWPRRGGIQNGLLTVSDLMGMPIQNHPWFDMIADHIESLIAADSGAPVHTRAYVTCFMKDGSTGYLTNAWTLDNLTDAVGLGDLRHKNFPKHTIFDAPYAIRLQKFLDKLQYARVLPVYTTDIPVDIPTTYGHVITPSSPPGEFLSAQESWDNMAPKPFVPDDYYFLRATTYVGTWNVDSNGVPIPGTDRNYGSSARFSTATRKVTMNTRNGLGFKGSFVKNVLVVGFQARSVSGLSATIGGHGLSISGTNYLGVNQFDHNFPMNGLHTITGSFGSGSPPFNGRHTILGDAPSFVDPLCGTFKAKAVIAPDFTPNGSSVNGEDSDLSYCILDISGVV